MKKLDLSEFAKGTMVLSGRKKGEAIREKWKLQTIDSNEIYEIIVPEQVTTFNPSFFLGLFGPTVRSLGEDCFKKTFHFAGSDYVLQDVEEGVCEALKESNVLGPS